MLETFFGLVFERWLAALIIVIAAWATNNRFNHGLQKYPGPLLASLTDWWRFFDVYGRRPDLTHQRLHKKHGDVVRLGPNSLSFADPKALKVIYGLNKGFKKSGFYPVQQAMSHGERLPSLFSTTDEVYHAQLRRCVNNAFSMSALVQYEPSVDIVTESFLAQTQKLYASTRVVCDFAQWLQFYAFDVIGEITYSESHGFVDRHEDIDGMVAYLGKLFSYVAPIGQMPFLDLIFLKNPILRLLDRYNVKYFTFPVVTFARARMAERLATMSCIEPPDGDTPVQREDLLSQFLKAKENNPIFFHDGRVLTMAVSMAFAGSETTAISLAAVFYFLLRNPRCLEILRSEIDNAISDGRLESRKDGLTSWAEAQSLPYLDACIKEAFRLHPAAGLPLERTTPPEGVEICGRHVPGGTIVGCSAWVIHRRPEIFGDDTDSYRPERWITAAKDQRKEMEGTMFQFGAGSRTCIGKNISLLEIYKLVPSFLRRFDMTVHNACQLCYHAACRYKHHSDSLQIQLANPDQDWRLHNAWFVKQRNFNTVFNTRPKPGIYLL